MIKDFVIPINKDELLQSTSSKQYFVEKVLPPRILSSALDETRAALQKNGASFIIEHFDVFFSVTIHGNKVELSVVMRAFNRILKGIEALITDLEAFNEQNVEVGDEEQAKFLCITKMYAYLFSWFVCYIEDEIVKNLKDSYSGKRKKSTKTDVEEEWECTREKALEFVYRWLQLPLQRLWQPPIVEDAFMVLLTKVCYKTLEESKDVKQKQLRQTVFYILGTAVKKYNQGISTVVRIIQLVKLHDALATHIANGIILMVTECGCKGLVREIMKEISQTELSETDSRNVSIFLESVATTKPDLILPLLDDIMDYLGNEHYSMRNCALGILGAVVQNALTGEDLTKEQRDQRDECLDSLNEHILDCNAYVRSKVLQIWQRLCCEGAIPLSRQGRLLAATALRLDDKSANVRKQALQLVRALLQSNPYAAKLNKEELAKSLAEEDEKLKEMQIELASKSARGDTERLNLWNALLPKTRAALKQVIDTNNNDEDDDEEGEDDEYLDPDTGFEHVRQLMLKEQVSRAVSHLWRLCITLKQDPEMQNLAPEAKEECLFLLLLKTFMESESDSSNTDATDKAAKAAEDNNLKEEIKAKRIVVTYLKNCLAFATELENAIPIVRTLLFSTVAGDAVEACTLLGTAYQFGIAGAAAGVREALFQVFHRDQSVRNNVAEVYKEIFLKSNENQLTERQKALTCVTALVELVKKLEPGQSPALVQLVITWYNNQELNAEVVKVLWEKFSMKLPDTTPLDSRAAIMLLAMIAQAQSGIITSNLDVLIKVGLGTQAKSDLLLARDTCRALLKIKPESDDIEKPALRFENNHKMFEAIIELLEENFTNEKEDGYISFATDAINVIYHLANQPDLLMKRLLLNIVNLGKFMDTEQSQGATVSYILLSKLLYIIGHIALRQMVHLDTSVYKELKRRDTLRKMKKEKTLDNRTSSARKSGKQNIVATPSSAGHILRNKEASSILEDNGEEAVEGAQDDADAEFINATLENQVVTGDGLLTTFLPLVMDVCQYPDKYNDANLQAAGALALSKMMTVSSSFCEKHLQLLVTIMERSVHPGIRSNILIGISDLTIRFPNEVEPWMKHVYARLRDDDVGVRKTCVRVLSNLILREMVRVRGQVSELALCIVDKDSQIRQDTKDFFKELSEKGNALYNVIPDILSRLTDPELNLEENDFHEVFQHILSLLQKEKQVDAIIDKICARFKLATTERQWRDFAYCLSLLQFSGKSIRRLIESLPLLKDKIHNPQVLKALQNVIEQTKKKPNAKDSCIELEEKIEELLKLSDNTEKSENEIMPPPPVPTVSKSRKTVRRVRRSSSDEDDEDLENDPDATSEGKPRRKRRSYERKKNRKSDSDSDAEDGPPLTPVNKTRRSKSKKQLTDSSDRTPAKRTKQVSTPSQQRSSMRLAKSRIRLS